MLFLMPVRLLALAALAMLAVALAGCGGDPPYALDPTADCLEESGAAVERWEADSNPPTYWSRPAPGGILRATGDDQQTALAAFADDSEEAGEMAARLESFEAMPGSLAGIMRPVVRRDRNAVVFGFFPEGDEPTPGFTAALDAVEDCLEEG